MFQKCLGSVLEVFLSQKDCTDSGIFNSVVSVKFDPPV